jgi:hypothetical protein
MDLISKVAQLLVAGYYVSTQLSFAVSTLNTTILKQTTVLSQFLKAGENE